MIATNQEHKPKRIEDLSLREIDMAYSLSRTGWSFLEIGRRYGISEGDVDKLVDDYVELREARKANPLHQAQKTIAAPESVTRTPRKRRSNAIYATSKDRQAAYRARLKQNRHMDTGQLSRVAVTDTTVPAGEEPSVTACEELSPETSPEHSYPQQFQVCDLSEPNYGHAENIPDSVTPKASSEGNEVQLTEK
jgi:hypothetical protein